MGSKVNDIQSSTSIIDDSNIAPFKGKVTGIWVDEAIWGHRIRVNSAIGNFQFMEFMSVVESIYRNDHSALFDPIEPEKGLTYKPRRNILLRNILFNNSALNRAESYLKDKTNEELWSDWIDDFQKSYEPSGLYPNLSFLQERYIDVWVQILIIDYMRTNENQA